MQLPWATGFAGGIFFFKGAPVIENCTIAENSGGGVICYYDCLITVHNSILWGNISGTSRHQMSLDGSIYRDLYPTVTISYSDIEGGEGGIRVYGDSVLNWGGGNIDADPCFAEAGYWDECGTPSWPEDDFWVEGEYHLKSQAGRWDLNAGGPTGPLGGWTTDDVTSPCIDAGDPMSPIGYEPFPNGGIINMGAYGGTTEASKSYFGGPPCETIVAGDVNGDCKVDFNDFTLMALHWLEER